MTILNTYTTYPIKAKSKNVIRINLGLPPSEQCSDLGGGSEHCSAMMTREANSVHYPPKSEHCSEEGQTKENTVH